jgi:hypothetical protein
VNRPAIPAKLKRDVLLEAGHRCAIPTCRQTTIEVAHITPYKTVKVHTFDNLIALCPTCHARYDKQEIDIKSMKRYKSNLILLNSRYSDLEKRVLEVFVENPHQDGIPIYGGLLLLVRYLEKDGLLDRMGSAALGIGGSEVYIQFLLTQKGKEFVERLRTAAEIR